MAALAVSLGDPAGIGPEIIAESWARRHDMALAPFFVVGGAGVLAKAAKVRGLAVEIERRRVKAKLEAPHANASC